MSEPCEHLYGPVPSRRLGLSLGVDIIPHKVCPLDCVYCQLGKTSEKSVERRDYVDGQQVLSQLEARIEQGLEADFITIGGSGEPTLNLQLGELVDGIKSITDIPVAVLTNGVLFYRQDVRDDCRRADVVLPSLDAGDEQTFRRINRPHESLSVEKVIGGLSKFREEFRGEIWLEVFLVEGVNTAEEQIARIKQAIGRIRPDKVQLNTAVRPTAERGVKKLEAGRLQEIALRLGPGAEVVADFPSRRRGRGVGEKADAVLSMLKRRPCSLNDVCSGLGIGVNEALKYIGELQSQGVVYSVRKGGTVFFKTR
ncbi:MAG TPA: radical SAM protein [Sedimentisphaerales bacterium]|nr:radical SAM protein [Sedimentisphaerales bacterium]